MNKFTFRPVGQGLFYTGSLENGTFNFVYDCGTENSQELINNEIESFAKEFSNLGNKKPELDFVVISHLHKDHYSGLYNLINKFHIKKIYLPYLNFFSYDVILLHLFYDIYIKNGTKENSEKYSYDKLQEENHNLFKLMKSLYRLSDNYAISDNEFYESDIEKVEFVRSSKINRYFDSLNDFWHFEFINKPTYKKNIEKINDQCDKLLKNSNCNNMQEYLELQKNNIKEIAKAYHQIFGKGNAINDTSIILLHQPNYSYKDTCLCIYNKTTLINKSIDINCSGKTLLTGDIKFTKPISNKIVNNDDMFVLQIPHHGSYDNWKTICDNIHAYIYAISFGYGNRYKHPSSKVIDDLMLNNDEFYCITQNQGLIYYIE